MEGRYDIVIIGAGPAGMEAAITAKIRNKRILLAGNGPAGGSGKVGKAHQVQNYLGLPDIGGEEMQIMREIAKEAGVIHEAD